MPPRAQTVEVEHVGEHLQTQLDLELEVRPSSEDDPREFFVRIDGGRNTRSVKRVQRIELSPGPGGDLRPTWLLVQNAVRQAQAEHRMVAVNLIEKGQEGGGRGRWWIEGTEDDDHELQQLETEVMQLSDANGALAKANVTVTLALLRQNREQAETILAAAAEIADLMTKLSIAELQREALEYADSARSMDAFFANAGPILQAVLPVAIQALSGQGGAEQPPDVPPDAMAWWLQRSRQSAAAMAALIMQHQMGVVPEDSGQIDALAQEVAELATQAQHLHALVQHLRAQAAAVAAADRDTDEGGEE